jgi:carboxyl-terminal processing protease
LGKIRTALIICCLVLIAGIFGYAYLTGNNKTVTDKETILANVETLGSEDYGYDYVSSYIKKLGIGNLNSYKINAIEQQLETDFYKELPTEQEIAKSTVLLFVEHFYDSTDLSDKGAVTDGILKCMLASIGDPYAYYRTAEEFAEYLAGLESSEDFVGIGIMVNRETLEIMMVYPDSGAEEAGILPRDVLHAVNGKTAEDVSVDELLDLITGEPDTTVNITVKRQDTLIDLVVTRRVLSGRTVYYTVNDDNVAIIEITQFLEITYQQFVEAVDYCTEQGAEALVIDVRYNPGGLVHTLAEVVDYLTPDADGRRIASYTLQGEEYVYYTCDGHSVDLPIAVICNEYTASAAELFAAAMRDYGREGVLDTVIVGSTTYGKGVAQNSYSLYDFSGITYTISYSNPPSNVNFDGIGVIPDIEVEEVSDEDAPMSRALEEVAKLVNTKSNADDAVGAAA